jgi:hypothetical protein
VAEDWRLCEESVRKEYEEKAQRYNAEEEKRWRQKLYLHQQQQMHLQASRRGRGDTCFSVVGSKSLPDLIWIRGKRFTILIRPSNDLKSLNFLSNSPNLTGTMMMDPNSKMLA